MLRHSNNHTINPELQNLFIIFVILHIFVLLSLYLSNVCVCVSVLKDLANHWTDMVILYNVALYMYVGPGKVYNYPKRNRP